MDQQLPPGLARLTTLLLDRRPEFANACVVKQESLEFPSPSGDPDRLLTLWRDEHGVASVEFGSWHTHADLWPRGEADLLDILMAILDDEAALLYDAAEPAAEPDFIDLREPDQLLDALTDRYSPEAGTLITWAGTNDGPAGNFIERKTVKKVPGPKR